jgi:hypothetical protein
MLGALGRMQVTFRWKADGLDDDQIHAAAASGTLTVGGLLKHLAAQEDYAAFVKIAGRPMPSEWDDNNWDEDPDWEFGSASQQSAAELYARYDAAVERAAEVTRAVLEERGMDGDSAVTAADGTRASIRRILFDRLEEYGRHTGHMDLLREALDGRVGEDPPIEWRPPWLARP